MNGSEGQPISAVEFVSLCNKAIKKLEEAHEQMEIMADDFQDAGEFDRADLAWQQVTQIALLISAIRRLIVWAIDNSSAMAAVHAQMADANKALSDAVDEMTEFDKMLKDIKKAADIVKKIADAAGKALPGLIG